MFKSINHIMISILFLFTPSYIIAGKCDAYTWDTAMMSNSDSEYLYEKAVDYIHFTRDSSSKMDNDEFNETLENFDAAVNYLLEAIDRSMDAKKEWKSLSRNCRGDRSDSAYDNFNITKKVIKDLQKDLKLFKETKYKFRRWYRKNH